MVGINWLMLVQPTGDSSCWRCKVWIKHALSDYTTVVWHLGFRGIFLKEKNMNWMTNEIMGFGFTRPLGWYFWETWLFFRFIYGMSSFPLTHMFQDGYCTTNQIIYIYYINHILIHILYQPAIDWGPFSSIFPRDFWIFQGPEKPHILWFLEWQGSNREDPMIKRINYPITISSSINIYLLYINIYIYNIYIY